MAYHCFCCLACGDVDGAAYICVHVQQAAAVLKGDCVEALMWCLEADKQYHKARRRLATLQAADGQHGEALATLRHCFTRPGRLTFALNMTQLQADATAGAVRGWLIGWWLVGQWWIEVLHHTVLPKPKITMP